MLKRFFDLIVSSILLFCSSPLFLLVAIFIYCEDKGSPFYNGIRVGKNGMKFKMHKFRTMIVNADRTGVDSTADNDPRITKVGKWLRHSKIDELPQLWNVWKGEMSLVGPRPNAESQVARYSKDEFSLLSVKPGITDLASIYFSNEGEILAREADVSMAYERLIRPRKSELGIYWLKNRSFGLDLTICLLTAINIFSHKTACRVVHYLVTLEKTDKKFIYFHRII